ncbi:MAG: YlbF family regulator [Halothiobacillaceae bacterium]
MTDLVLSDIAIAPPEVVRHATRDLAAALAQTPAFRAFAQAAAAFRQDEVAQRAVQAYQLKQQSLQMMLMLNAVSAEDRAELNRLYQEFATRPSVLAYVQAEAELRTVCQAVADRLSQQIGFDFVSACGSGCC